jgi:hypothetical protein
VLHRRWSEALLSEAEAQVQHSHTTVTAHLQVSATSSNQDLLYTQSLPLGWWSLHPAGPDIHLLSKTPRNPHRRLSLCSLPVPKQFGESLGSLISFAQSANGGTWQPAHRNNPDVSPFLEKPFKLPWWL